jgi:hypothetical protein
MLIKQCQFWGRTESGIFCQPLFGSAGVFEKTAGAPPFSDWSTGDELRDFIEKIPAGERKKSAYVLVNALGAGEYFGSNINADYFPWNALTHEGEDYGYKTFLNAHAFQHHANKDPSRAFGQPVLSLLNPQMKRVELIIRLDRERAKVEQADGIINRIDMGEFPDVSMGCKVPYDICSICGNESKTRDDYCKHMRPPEEHKGEWGPNKILPDGRRIYVINTLPRFFDISFVFIGADKTAKVMAKVASRGNQVCLGDICTIPRPSAEVAHMVQVPESYGVEKTASAPCEVDCCKEKMAEFGIKSASEKLSEILKQVPANKFTELTVREPNIPNLERHAEEMPLSSICSTAGAMGIPLKPQEFQTIVLVKMGYADWARELNDNNLVFRQVPGVIDQVGLDMKAVNSKLAADLMSVVQYRTAFGEPFALRRLGFEKTNQKALPTPNPITHSLLDKISAAYNGYRQNLLLKISQAAAAVEGDPQLRQALNGRMLINMFAKTASVPTLNLDSVAYIAGAYMASSLFSNAAVTMAVSADRWLQDHIPA